MKISKKLIVSSLASIMGISMVGAISGTVAWYRYNTVVSTSLIGTNVANTGILEISANNTDWKADLTTSELAFAGSRADTVLNPCTFYDGSNSLASNVALPANAYKRPDAGKNRSATNPGSYAEVFEAATAQYDYIQYSFYLRARTVDDVTGGLQQKAEDVFLTDFTLVDAVAAKPIASGMRVHLAIDADGNDAPEKFVLMSLSAKTTNIYGNLDLDNDGVADIVGGYEWNANRTNTVTYGANEKTVTSVAAPVDATMTGDALFSTPATGAAKITVTIWLEGWDTSLASPESALWSGENHDGAGFRFGMTFGVKANAFEN